MERDFTAKWSELKLDLMDRTFSEKDIESNIEFLHVSRNICVEVREHLDDYLVCLSRRPDVLLSLKVGTLRDYISLARQSTFLDEIADNVSLFSAVLCDRDHSLIAPLFEFLASGLSSDKLNAVFCAAAAFSDDELERCLRLAESMRKFGDQVSLGLLLINLHRSKPGWLRKPKLLRSFQPLLSSPHLDALASHVGEEIISSIRDVVKLTERFRDAVVTGDREAARQILRDEDGLANVDFIRWMDSLRSLTFELKKMALPVSDLRLTGIDRSSWQKLAAVRFFDHEAIETMRGSGALKSRSDLNATALSIVGDNSMLDSIISDKFAAAGLHAMNIEGQTAGEVFLNAATSTRGLQKIDGPLISVIMSVYNPDLELMKLSLDSIRDQTWNNVEIIVVDDASSAPTQAAIRALVAHYEHVDVIVVAMNSGPYIGRNFSNSQSARQIHRDTGC